jgi:hypothetical protein
MAIIFEDPAPGVQVDAMLRSRPTIWFPVFGSTRRLVHEARFSNV